jgi:cell division septation protein DedD
MGKLKTYIIIFLFGCFFIGCSSGEYDLEKTTIENTQKIVVRDTLNKPISNENEEIKEEIRSPFESYSYVVQIGAFFMENNFQAFLEKSKSLLGSDVYYTYMNSLYKIRIGNYNNKDEALKLLNHVISLGFYDAFVITVKK